MLVDPLGSVHATSGILPVKEITLSSEEYSEALNNIEVTFFNAPILTPHGKRSLALPDEIGFDWAWLEHKRWIEKNVFKESIDAINASESKTLNAEVLWNKLRDPDINWISCEENNSKARIIPMGRRKLENLDDSFLGSEIPSNNDEKNKKVNELEDLIERMFWSRYSSITVIEREFFVNQLMQLTKPEQLTKLTKGDCLQVWNYLLDTKVNWLSIITTDVNRANVLNKKDRKLEILKTNLSDSLSKFWFLDLQKKIEQIIDNEALAITSIDTKASFEGAQEIREGWLVLRKPKNTH